MINIEQAAAQYQKAVFVDKTHICFACDGWLEVTQLADGVGICCEVCRVAVVVLKGVNGVAI